MCVCVFHAACSLGSLPPMASSLDHLCANNSSELVWTAVALALAMAALGICAPRGAPHIRRGNSYKGSRSPRSATPHESYRAARSMIATEEEADVIEEVRAIMATKPPLAGVPENHELLDVQLLRFVREHGHNAHAIERHYRKALKWKASNLPEMPIQVEQATYRWLSASEMPHGEWATQYTPIGMHCGYSRNGHPVKLERLGKFDISGLKKHKDVRRHLNAFYLGLVDCLQRRLDETSLERGELQQTYEIFDLEGLGPHMINFTTINFTRDVLLAFATHYPSSFAKAVIINSPPVLYSVWSVVASVLPNSVKSKVKIMGKEYHDELAADLTEEALAWVSAPDDRLIHAPHASNPHAGRPSAEASANTGASAGAASVLEESGSAEAAESSS